MRRIETKFKEGAGIGKEIDALAGSQARFRVLVFDRLCASAFADLFLFVADLGYEVGKRTHIRFEAERTGINFGGQNVVDRNGGRVGAFAHESRVQNKL